MVSENHPRVNRGAWSVSIDANESPGGPSVEGGQYSEATMALGHEQHRERPGPSAGGSGRRYRHGEFDISHLSATKGGRLISVCIPARNEVATVGAVVGPIVAELTRPGGGPPLVDEVLVIDDGSSDGTGDVARAAGARVVRSGSEASGGKGQAMRLALEASSGDLIVFVDADVTNFASHFVTGLVGPLLDDPSTMLVKGHYRRPLHDAADGGGRVTELVAKPLIDLLFPALSGVVQPLAGETAAPRAVLEKCGLADGYAVELALLIDVGAEFGAGSIAQVDLGVRVHRNRPLSELRPQATEIIRTALVRAGRDSPDVPVRLGTMGRT
jgi:glucosyl-3-phosphoglycerate synthase